MRMVFKKPHYPAQHWRKTVRSTWASQQPDARVLRLEAMNAESWGGFRRVCKRSALQLLGGVLVHMFLCLSGGHLAFWVAAGGLETVLQVGLCVLTCTLIIELMESINLSGILRQRWTDRAATELHLHHRQFGFCFYSLAELTKW